MKKNIKNNVSLLLIFNILIMLLFSNSYTIVNAQNTKIPIKLGITLWVPNFLAYIAQEKGYFKKNNVEVNMTLLQNYNNVINNYSNGEFDGIFTVYSDAIIQHSTGIDTKVVYNVDSSFKADAIVGKGNNLSDVKGKKIGVDGINSFSHFFVLKSLENAGLEEGDVQFVNVPAQNTTQALQKDQIFAGHTYAPFLSDALKKGYKILSTGATIPGIITNVMAFHSSIVEQRPQDLQNIIRSMDEAKADYDKNKGQDVAIMSLKSGLSKAEIIEGMENAKIFDLNYNHQTSMNKNLNQTSSLYISGNYIAKFYAERGVISEYPNIDEIVDSKFVDALLKDNSSMVS
jgi:NitT/TauT family transport system substrate-binding protein